MRVISDRAISEKAILFVLGKRAYLGNVYRNTFKRMCNESFMYFLKKIIELSPPGGDFVCCRGGLSQCGCVKRGAVLLLRLRACCVPSSHRC